MPVSGLAPGRPGQGPGERPGTQPARPGQAAKPKPETRPAQAVKPVQPKVKPAGGPNNVLADKNGNVYRRDNQGNMQPRQGNEWKPCGNSGKTACRGALVQLPWLDRRQPPGPVSTMGS